MVSTTLLLWIIIGAVAGWMAGELMRGDGFGVVGNMIVGILGSFVGGLFFDSLGVGTSITIAGSLVMAVIGAMILLFAVETIQRTV